MCCVDLGMCRVDLGMCRVDLGGPIVFRAARARQTQAARKLSSRTFNNAFVVWTTTVSFRVTQSTSITTCTSLPRYHVKSPSMYATCESFQVGQGHLDHTSQYAYLSVGDVYSNVSKFKVTESTLLEAAQFLGRSRSVCEMIWFDYWPLIKSNQSFFSINQIKSKLINYNWL